MDFNPAWKDIALNVLPRLLAHRPMVHRARLGAALVGRRGAILSVGFNRAKTHPKAAHWHAKAGRSYCTSIHAEMDVAIGVGDVSGAVLVVSRTLQDGSLGLALPCPSCFCMLSETRIANRIVFTTAEAKTPLATINI